MSAIDYNDLSLFTTPLGEAVQKEKTGMLLDKIDAKTTRALYISEVYESLSTLSQSFWDIDLTIKLIEFADPKIKSFKMARVDRADYIKYHFENYFFRLPKFKDQVLQLLNVIFRLGYNQGNGLEKKIRSTQILQEKKLLYFIDYFNNVFSDIKPIRDIIAHRGDLYNHDFAMLTSYSLLKDNDKIYDSLLKGQIAYTFVFKKNQGILKQAVITLLLLVYEDFCTTLEIME